MNTKDEFDIDAFIGANIRKFREIQGIERKELAAVFHITDDALYRIEKGQTGLSGTYGYILANELHCDMNFIFGSNPVLDIVDSEKANSITQKKMARMLRYMAELLDGGEHCE